MAAGVMFLGIPIPAQASDVIHVAGTFNCNTSAAPYVHLYSTARGQYKHVYSTGQIYNLNHSATQAKTTSPGVSQATVTLQHQSGKAVVNSFRGGCDN